MDIRNTYGHAGRPVGSKMRMSMVLCLIIVLIAGVITPYGTSVKAASGLKIRFHQNTKMFTGTKLSVTLNGKSVNLHNTPGLALHNSQGTTIYMMSAEDVFRKACGVSYSYKNKKIVLKQFGTTIRMTLDSKTAYVNGKRTKLEYAPTLIKFYNVNKTKLYVPAKFVATTFGYTYGYARTSSKRVTVKMTAPSTIKYDGKWVRYKKPYAKLSFDGTNVAISDMYCVSIDSNFYVQAKAFAKTQIGGKCSYNRDTKKLTITFGDKKLIMKTGSTAAELNGKKVTLNKPVRAVTNGKTNKEYVMVPIASVAAKLGLKYSYVSQSTTCTLGRKDGVYFDWKAPKIEAKATTISEADDEGVLEEPEEETTKYYVDNTVGKRIGTTDVVSIDGNFPKNHIKVQESGKTITVTIKDSTNRIGKENFTLSNPYLLKSASLSHNSSGDTILKIVKKSTSVKYVLSTEADYASITLSTGVVKNGYTIAVDVGHGAYTAGKRTPKLLESLDFDKDGKIDAKKGTQIREHTANTGVGNYAVAALERCGFEVYKSGFGTADTPLLTRQKNIKAAKSDYSISIHFDAAGTGSSYTSASGIGIYTHAKSANVKNSVSLAKAILNQTARGTAQKNRGVNKEHTFAMCNASAMGTKGSVLLECAFMTNWHEVKTMMANTAYWRETGEEIAKGFCNYLGVKYVEPK